MSTYMNRYYEPSLCFKTETLTYSLLQGHTASWLSTIYLISFNAVLFFYRNFFSLPTALYLYFAFLELDH